MKSWLEDNLKVETLVEYEFLNHWAARREINSQLSIARSLGIRRQGHFPLKVSNPLFWREYGGQKINALKSPTLQIKNKAQTGWGTRSNKGSLYQSRMSLKIPVTRSSVQCHM